MKDNEIVEQIDQLVDQEHDLERRHAADGLSEAERKQLQEIEVRLDQCWDLLRQRRARRSAGQDPGDAQVRSAEVVEHNQQ
jgi:hypothetical protein